MWERLCDVLTDLEYLQERICSLQPARSEPGRAEDASFRRHPGDSVARLAEEVARERLRVYADVVFVATHDDAHSTVAESWLRAVQSPLTGLLQDFRNALDLVGDSRREELAMLGQAIAAYSTSLSGYPSLLVEAVYNWREWEEGSSFERQLAEAVQRRPRPWLRRANRPRAAPQPGSADRQPFGIREAAGTAAFSPDGSRTGTGRLGDASVSIWNTETGERLRQLWGERKSVRSVAFSPDGSRLAVGGVHEDPDVFHLGKVNLWDTRTGKLEWTLLGEVGWVNSVAFSPAGEMLALGTENARVELCDAATGRLQPTLAVHFSGSVRAVDWSPDGRAVASAGGGKVEVWDVETGELQRALRHEHGDVSSVAFSADGETLVAGVSEPWGPGEIVLWELGAERMAWSSSGHIRPVAAVAFSSDGGLLASASEDGTLGVWDAQTGGLIARGACQGAALAVWFDPVLPQVRAVDGGGWDDVPHVHVLEITGS
jgi:hypothetical protein